MVDQILQLSHTYNPHKNISSSPETKNRKKSSLDLQGANSPVPKPELFFLPADFSEVVSL